MQIDPLLKNDIRAHIRESQQNDKAREYHRTLEATRAWARAAENRAKVQDMMRPLIAEAVRSKHNPFKEEDVRMMCSRDAQLRAYLDTPQTREISPSAVHVNQLLTNLSVRFFNSDFIGEMIAPPVQVSKESDLYAVYNERDNLAFPSNVVGARGSVPEIGQSVDLTANYRCVFHGFKELVTPRSIANADSPLDPLLDAQMLVMEGNAWNREKESATFFTTSGNYASANVTAVSAGEEWNSVGGGNPVKQIQDARKSIFRTRGATRIIGATSIDVFTVLSRHAHIRDLFKYTKEGFATRQQLAGYFGLDDLFVSEAWEDTANKGQTASYSRIWGDYFLIAAINPSPSVRSYNFASRFRCDAIQSETLFVVDDGYRGVYHVKETYAETIESVAPRAGALISGALA
jgi:hypothetical protein